MRTPQRKGKRDPGTIPQSYDEKRPNPTNQNTKIHTEPLPSQTAVSAPAQQANTTNSDILNKEVKT